MFENTGAVELIVFSSYENTGCGGVEWAASGRSGWAPQDALQALDVVLKQALNLDIHFENIGRSYFPTKGELNVFCHQGEAASFQTDPNISDVNQSRIVI